MRTPLLAGLLALVLPACLMGEISDVGGDDPGMGSGDGDGDGDGDGSDNVPVPRVTLSVDQTTVTSDLNVETTITITATGSMGFAGDVTLAVSAMDAAEAAITDWTATLDTTTLTLAQDGAQTATLKLSALGDTAALTGNVKITATSTVAAADATVAVTFNPVLAVTFADNGAGKCVYPVNHAVNNPWRIKEGRQLKIVNGSPTLGLQVHTDNNIGGFPHQNNVAPPGEAYVRTLTTAGDIGQFYCHDGNNNGNVTMTEEGGTIRNYVRVVQ